MKGPVMLLAFFLVNLVSFYTVSAETSVITLERPSFKPPLRDAYNKLLLTNTRYFIVEGLTGLSAGGVSPGPKDEVLMSTNIKELGVPVVFIPKGSLTGQVYEEIPEYTPLNVKFAGNTDSTRGVWKVEGFPGSKPPFNLSTNGVEGNPLDVTSWFEIRKFNYYSFQFVFCPYGEDSSCSPVGYEVVDGHWRFAVGASNKIAKVVFPPIF